MSTLAERRSAKLAAGICRDCTNPRAPDKKFCQKCLCLIRDRNNTRYKKLKKGSLCVWCGKRPTSVTNDCSACAKKRRRNVTEWWVRRKMEVFEAYGGAICACCSEESIEFLTIDHINGGGTRHREDLKASGSSFYAWLKKNKWPEGYRVLCYNCNCSLGHFGYCPHKNSK